MQPMLTPRAATKEVADALVREMRWYDDYLAKGDVDRGANTTPGNKKGGLSNIIEKSLGSVAKSGTSTIPFPFPKAGEDLLWNHNFRWRGGRYSRFLARTFSTSRRPEL